MVTQKLRLRCNSECTGSTPHSAPVPTMHCGAWFTTESPVLCRGTCGPLEPAGDSAMRKNTLQCGGQHRSQPTVDGVRTAGLASRCRKAFLDSHKTHEASFAFCHSWVPQQAYRQPSLLKHCTRVCSPQSQCQSAKDAHTRTVAALTLTASVVGVLELPRMISAT